MLPPPSSAALAAFYAVLVALPAFAFGYLLVVAADRKSAFDQTTRVALAFPALVAYTFVLMLIHIVTGGRVFSQPIVTIGITLVTAGALLVLSRRQKGDREGRPRADALVWAGVACIGLGLAVWVVPVLTDFPMVLNDDMYRHLGWASQLRAGETTPSSGITGDIPNDYPWLYHSLMAFLMHFSPGGRAGHTLGTLQILQVTGMVAALYALGTRLRPHWVTGVTAALFGGLAGGFGFLMLREPDVVMNRLKNALEYHGDLLFTRSYNYAFQNLAPPFPRDVGYTLFPVFLLLLMLGLSQRRRGPLVAAGAALGGIGLCHIEGLMIGLVVGVIACVVIGRRERKLLDAVAVVVPALAIFGVWAVPMAVTAARLGGFVDHSIKPLVLPAGDILFSWGIVTPFGIVGALMFARKALADVAGRLPDRHVYDGVALSLILLVVSLGVVASSAATGAVLGEGVRTLTFDNRFWPYVFLALALLGAIGAHALFEKIAERRALAYGGLAVIAALAVASPLMATIAVRSTGEAPEPFKRALAGDENILHLLSPKPGARCNVAVPQELIQQIHAYAGYRLLTFAFEDIVDPVRGGAHIRWVDIYEHVTPNPIRMRDNDTLVRGEGTADEWLETAREHDLDKVAVHDGALIRPALRSVDAIEGGRYGVIRLSKCE